MPSFLAVLYQAKFGHVSEIRHPGSQFLSGYLRQVWHQQNLLREVSLSVIAALIVAMLVQMLLPKLPSPITEVRDLINPILRAQHRADSIINLQREWLLQDRIDSLTFILHQPDELDSMRAKAGLSLLGAMQRMTGAIPTNARLETRRGNE